MLLFRIINKGENQWPNKSCPYVLNIIYSYITPCNRRSFSDGAFLSHNRTCSPLGAAQVYTQSNTQLESVADGSQ